MEEIKRLYNQWQHLASPLFFVTGFLFDVMTLGRVDEALNFIVLLFYLFMSFLFFCIDFGAVKIPSGRWKRKVIEYQDEIFHFCQGALLSAFTLFYFKSASGAYSFIFMSLLILLLLVNELEIIKKRGVLIKSIFFNLTLMSFLLVYIPLPFGQVGLTVFITALTLYLLMAFAISKFFMSTKIDREEIKKIWIIPAVSFFFLFLFLRLFKLIPPVPLSIETAGIYHSVEKKYPAYHLSHQRKWWRFWHHSDEHFSYRSGDKVYFFTRIFAPRGFKDQVFVKWMKYTGSSWHQSDRIPLNIIGGRGKGFRGYTYKSYITPGEWKVTVETKGGIEIGRLGFDVVPEKGEDLTKERVFTEVIDD